MWRRMVPLCAVLTVVMAVSSPATAADDNYELQVRRTRWGPDSQGVLTFANDGVTFHRSGSDFTKWAYDDVRQIQILSPTRVAILTYRESGPLTFRRDERLVFVLTSGQVSSDLVSLLLARAGKTVVSAVLPPGFCCSQGAVRAVWRRRGADASGVLSIHTDAVAFEGARPGDTRVWQIADMVSVLRIDPARLEIVAFEGGGGATRRFLFELMEPLPKNFYEQIWDRVNAPEPVTIPQASTGGAQ